MADKMLIDASHLEETRVVVVHGNRIEEFDFESQHKKQLRGNIYLAKVMRVEPSLQAAFVDYGGNRHGFLAFSEIHPDYYQIPLADRQALLEAEAAEAAEAEATETSQIETGQVETGQIEAIETDLSELDEKTINTATEAPENKPENKSEDKGEIKEPSKPKKTRSRRRKSPVKTEKTDQILAPSQERANVGQSNEISENPDNKEQLASSFNEEPQSEHDDLSETIPSDPKDKPDTIAAITETDDEISEAIIDNKHAIGEDANNQNDDSQNEDDSKDESENNDITEIEVEDALTEIPDTPRKTRKQYRIQGVIKRRQILLVQIVKEERGNKGAALTTYMSLAGRYSVLMPNTARGGGISRKITNVQDRKRLKETARELDVPKGMGVILRTAGASRTKIEIRRDFEYLMRLWENVRTLTLNSMAPCLVYEEGSLIKRSIRDLYNKNIGEIIVAGEEGYREAKSFMKMLMPSQAKVVQPYNGSRQIFTNNDVEKQLDQMMSPQVTLKSGGYLIINQTEALVAIDVNSGRSTRETSIEDTALQTNLEAAEEVARQLKLRDLAGLVVVDFIDMEEKNNNRTVEKRLKDYLKQDRARIQVGRISQFGLLEMSRQRIRASVLESTTINCPHCEGTGHLRSSSSLAIHILRGIEEQLLKAPRKDVNVYAEAAITFYILNHKRQSLTELEQRFNVTITINIDPLISNQEFSVKEGDVSLKTAEVKPEHIIASSYGEADSDIVGEEAGQISTLDEASDENNDNADNNANPRKRRRRRRQRSNGNGNISENQENQSLENNDILSQDAARNENDDKDDQSEKRRRRGKRGGRKNRDHDNSENITIDEGNENIDNAPSDEVREIKLDQEPSTNEHIAPIEKGKKPPHRRTKKVDKANAPIEEGLMIETHKASSGTGEEMIGKTGPEPSVEKTSKPNRESRTNLDIIASEPVVTSSKPVENDGDDTPKKTGWWRRAFKN